MPLDDYLGFILNNASRKLNQFAVNFFKPYDITPEQAGIIRRLGEEEGISQKELSKRMAKDQTNITRLLIQLERKGLIMKGSNIEDRRSLLIYLTDKGRAVNEKIVSIESEIMRASLTGIPEERMALLKEIINEIIENINDHNNIDKDYNE